MLARPRRSPGRHRRTAGTEGRRRWLAGAAERGELKKAVRASAGRAPLQAAAEIAENTAANELPRRTRPVPTWFWIVLGVGLALLALFYVAFNLQRLEVFKMLLSSFFPLALLILAVLGSIVFGLATPTEAAAVGAFGG